MTTATQQHPVEPNWFQRKYAVHVTNQNKQLLARILNSADLKPPHPPTIFVGVGLALMVHLLTFALLIGGL